MANPKIVGTGSWHPKEILDNKYFKKLLKINIKLILDLSGIKERRRAGPNETTTDMAYNAAISCIHDTAKNLGISVTEVVRRIKKIIVGTETPEKKFPNTPSGIHKRLESLNYGIGNIPLTEMAAGCSGFLYALDNAHSDLLSGKYGNDDLILVIGADKLTSITNYDTPGLNRDCFLFGDAAGAVMVKNHLYGLEIIYSKMSGDGKAGDGLLELRIGENGQRYMHMEGKKVLTFATRTMADLVNDLKKEFDLPVKKIWLLAHQANLRILKGVAKRCGISIRSVLLNIEKFGNTSSATIPTALDEAWRTGRISDGRIIIMTGFGAGFTSGIILTKFHSFAQ